MSRSLSILSNPRGAAVELLTWRALAGLAMLGRRVSPVEETARFETRLTGLGALPASAVCRVLASPGAWPWTVCITRQLRSEGVEPDFCCAWLDWIADATALGTGLSEPATAAPAIPSADPLLARAIGNGRRVDLLSADRAAKAWKQGMEFLMRVDRPLGDRVGATVLAIVAIDGNNGETRLFSTEDWPGLVVVNANAAPAIIAEQLVNGASHVEFDLFLSAGVETRSWLARLPALWSVFTNSPQPAVPLAQGVLCYRRVWQFWRSMERCQQTEATGRPFEPTAISERIKTLGMLSQSGRAELLAVMCDEEVARWADIERALAPTGPTPIAAVTPSAEPPTAMADALSVQGMGDVEIAEVLLALAGEKVSRLTVPLSLVPALRRAVPNTAGLCFSRRMVVAEEDAALGGFSNRVAGFVSYRGQEDGDVFAYVAATPRSARNALVADEIEEAGPLLGIPRCCQESFARRWPEADARMGGDVAQLLLEESAHHHLPTVLPWECDSWAHYRGGGLTWHFPCRLDCEATIRSVGRRFELLSKLAPALAQRLLASYQFGQPFPVLGRRWSRLDERPRTP